MDIISRFEKFSLVDIILAQVEGMFFILIISKLIPTILELNVVIYAVLSVAHYVKPVYVLCFNKIELSSRRDALSWFDIRLLQFGAIFLALTIAKFVPELMQLNIWIFVVLFIITFIKPVYVFWFK